MLAYTDTWQVIMMNRKQAWIAACVICAALYGLAPPGSAAPEGGRHWTSMLAALYKQASAPVAEAAGAAQPPASGRPQAGSWPNPDTGLRPAATGPTASAAPGGTARAPKAAARKDKPQPSRAAAATAAAPVRGAVMLTAASVQAAAAPSEAADAGTQQQPPTPTAAPAGGAAGAARAAQRSAGEPAATALDSAVEGWKAALAQERGFESWAQAIWNSYPLGPGTHGWVVLLYNEGKEVGYMVVHAAENGGYRLTEYGTGDSPLFSYATLYRSLVQQELIPRNASYAGFIHDQSISKQRLYYHALAALWKIGIGEQTYFLDAKTGELLPLTAEPAEEAAVVDKPQATLSGGTIDERRLPAFDPYDRLPWIEGKPLAVHSLPELKSALDNNPRLTYVAELYNGRVTMPLAVTGYRKAGANEPYLVLDQAGPRYIRLQDALSKGGFYP